PDADLPGLERWALELGEPERAARLIENHGTHRTLSGRDDWRAVSRQLADHHEVVAVLARRVEAVALVEADGGRVGLDRHGDAPVPRMSGLLEQRVEQLLPHTVPPTRGHDRDRELRRAVRDEAVARLVGAEQPEPRGADRVAAFHRHDTDIPRPAPVVDV